MRRRDFIMVLVGAAAWMPAARAQEPQRVIGFLTGTRSPDIHLPFVTSFLQGLKDSGFVEGRNVKIEYRQSEDYDRLRSLAAELVSRDVAVIVAIDLPSAFAAKAATRTIPIVFAIGADPVKLSLVDSFKRPGGNLTGVSTLMSVLGPKCVELRHELLPVACLYLV